MSAWVLEKVYLATDQCTKIRLSNLNLREGLLYIPRGEY